MEPLIRAGSGIIVLSVLLYLVGSPLVSAPDGVGANIGAGLLMMLVGAVFLLGAALSIVGVVRLLMSHQHSSKRQDPS